MPSEEWWREGVIYRVYPRSFQDSNADGIGDLRVAVDCLEYLQWLGAPVTVPTIGGTILINTMRPREGELVDGGLALAPWETAICSSAST